MRANRASQIPLAKRGCRNLRLNVLRQLHLEDGGVDPCETVSFDVQNGVIDGTEQENSLWSRSRPATFYNTDMATSFAPIASVLIRGKVAFHL